MATVMVARPSPSAVRKSRRWTAVVGTVLVIALMWTVSEEINPDWYSYAALYSGDGSWLADQGRDWLFVLLLRAASAIGGPDNYIYFRICIGAYFAAFTYLLVEGRLFGLERAPRSNSLLLIGILPFIAPRFTIQIREGLAVTLALIGMALLARCRVGTQRSRLNPLYSGAALALFIASYATHSGVLILLVAMLGSWVHLQKVSSSLAQEVRLLSSISALTVPAFGFAAWVLPETREGRQAIDDVYGWMVDGSATVTFAKWLYWLAYGLGIAVVVRRLVKLYLADRLPTRLRAPLGLLAIVVLPAIYVAAVVLLASGAPSIVIAAASRLMNMVLSVLFVMFSTLGAMNRRLAALAVFLLIDQARIIIEAVFTTFGDVS